MTDDKDLTALLSAPTAPTLPPRSIDPDKAFTRRLDVKANTLEAELRGPAGEVTDDAAADFLREKGLDPAEWVATSTRFSEWTMPNGEVGVSKRFGFARRGTVADTGAGLILPDLDDLHAMLKRTKPRKGAKPKAGTVAEGVTAVGVIADPQVGKTGTRGGAVELLARLEASLERFEAYCLEVRPEEIVLVDAGDAIENFESVASEDRTNDLQLTEQIRLWRRIFWSWIDRASTLAPSVKVLSVGSNHCAVRRGKNNMGTPSDDYGIEVLAQVADMASVHPERYGHVEFFTPGRFEESVALQAVGGKVLGVAHGHQAKSINGLPTWFAGQALGRTPIGSADVIVFGHWHNLRIQTVGDDRWLFIAPTSDNGSDWFRNLSGNESAPGVLAFTLDADGWRKLHVC